MRLTPAPRLVDATLLVTVVTVLGSGIWTAFAGAPGDAWVFAAHGIAGVVLVPVLVWKLRRVGHRLHPGRWSRRTIPSALALFGTLAALGTGLLWAFGGPLVLSGWNAITLHALLGVLVVPFLFVHLLDRFRTPERVDFEGRRTALQYALLVGGGAIAWRLQRVLVSALELVDDRRFTGSRKRGAAPGNTFPVTMWVADDPDPIDRGSWSLSLRGAVAVRQSYGYEEILTASDERRATLDCTGGWYTTQDWQGVRVGRLLDDVDPEVGATWVTFHSVTGYRWSLPIEEAREALLATHVGGERLTHGHGAPARLVAPGRRGFQWVKWVEVIEVRTTPDYGQWLAIFTSGFDGV